MDCQRVCESLQSGDEDATDIKESAQRLLTKAAGGHYSPRRPEFRAFGILPPFGCQDALGTQPSR